MLKIFATFHLIEMKRAIILKKQKYMLLQFVYAMDVVLSFLVCGEWSWHVLKVYIELGW